jgi:hypothetical protein
MRNWYSPETPNLHFERKESPMFTTTIAVDLAKNVFELAVATQAGRSKDRKRLSRPQFERFWAAQAPCRVIMEACATAHFGRAS